MLSLGKANVIIKMSKCAGGQTTNWIRQNPNEAFGIVNNFPKLRGKKQKDDNGKTREEKWRLNPGGSVSSHF